MLAVKISRSQIPRTALLRTRAIASSAPLRSERKVHSRLSEDPPSKALITRVAVGFVAGLSIALYSGWTNRAGTSNVCPLLLLIPLSMPRRPKYPDYNTAAHRPVRIVRRRSDREPQVQRWRNYSKEKQCRQHYRRCARPNSTKGMGR